MSAKKGNILLPLISVVAVIAILTAGYFFWQTQQLQQTSSNQQSVVRKSSPTPTQDETANPDSIRANWKTYTSTLYQFTIQYPSDWNINTSALDTSTSVTSGIAEGRFYIQLFPNKNQKLEIFFKPTNELLDTAKIDGYTEKRKVQHHGIEWSEGIANYFQSNSNTGFAAYALFDKSYPGVSDNKIMAVTNGYSFTGIESSTYSDALAEISDKVLATLKFL